MQSSDRQNCRVQLAVVRIWNRPVETADMLRHAMIVLLAVLALSSRAATAEEVIKSFDAAIQLEASGELDVTETITVHAMGDRIRHGIYRDLPFSWSEGDDTAFKIVSIERDGQRDEWSRQAISGGTRIYLGSRNQMVPPGDHTYRIRYRTDNQVRRHDTYDNLVWNVTGNGWLFPIESATATVSLPGNAKPEDATVYTGPRGARGKDATAQLSGTTASFAMTRGLTVGEGLTIDVKIPRGVISPPKPVQHPAFERWDGEAAIAGGGILAIALLILFVLWFHYGRDPAKGPTPLRWTPPEGLSPGVTGYIQDGGFPNSGYTAISASIIDLAAKGYLEISDFDKGSHVKRTQKRASKLPYDQSMIIRRIENADGYMQLSNDNIYYIHLMIKSYENTVEEREKGIYREKNKKLEKAGYAITITSILASITLSNQPKLIYFAIIVVSFISYIIILLTPHAVDFLIETTKSGKAITRKKTKRISMALITPIAFASIWILARDGNYGIAVELGFIYGFLLAALTLVSLMGKGTKQERKIKDQIEGLREYLTLSKKRRATMQDLPIMSSAHFESLLPYAIVLGVDGPWMRAFDKCQESQARVRTKSYVPKWWTDGSLGLVTRDYDSRLHRSVRHRESDSSSFGSGFSGSGGGGGGGGGW